MVQKIYTLAAAHHQNVAILENQLYCGMLRCNGPRRQKTKPIDDEYYQIMIHAQQNYLKTTKAYT